MRTLLLLLAATFAASGSAARVAPSAQGDSTGLPGDHFDLRGALELFKNAKDIEAFEHSLNTEDQRVSNLDLDGNGQVDYIRVVDHAEGDAHAIVLQVALSKEEAQDVAVIELEKNGEASATVQIRGAEELYGPDAIIEPVEEEASPKMKGPSASEDLTYVWINVWGWPCVTWIYGPAYIVWQSPWYWDYYPPWWRPWRPWGWNAWWGWNRPYWGWYHPVGVCRVANAHAIYRHRAVHSPRIRQQTQPVRSARSSERLQPSKEVRPTREIKQPAARPANPRRQGGGSAKPSRSPQPASRPAPSRGGSPGRTAPVRKGR